LHGGDGDAGGLVDEEVSAEFGFALHLLVYVMAQGCMTAQYHLITDGKKMVRFNGPRQCESPACPGFHLAAA
jgi:hypothetical protein